MHSKGAKSRRMLPYPTVMGFRLIFVSALYLQKFIGVVLRFGKEGKKYFSQMVKSRLDGETLGSGGAENRWGDPGRGDC